MATPEKRSARHNRRTRKRVEKIMEKHAESIVTILNLNTHCCCHQFIDTLHDQLRDVVGSRNEPGLYKAPGQVLCATHGPLLYEAYFLRYYHDDKSAIDAGIVGVQGLLRNGVRIGYMYHQVM